MKKLLPILLLLLGGGGGVGAGYFLRPIPAETDMATEMQCAAEEPDCEDAANDGPSAGTELAEEGRNAETAGENQGEATEGAEGSNGPEYVALQRQMIVPIVSDDEVISLVVLSLSIEIEAGFTNDVYDREPKLRDAFLQVLFRHANTGGFTGDFTSGEKMSDLRRALNGAAAQVLGAVAIQVLVTDILRQET